MLEAGRRVTEYGPARQVSWSWVRVCGTGDSVGAVLPTRAVAQVPPFLGLRMEEAEAPWLPPSACTCLMQAAACSPSEQVLLHHPCRAVIVEH